MQTWVIGVAGGVTAVLLLSSAYIYGRLISEEISTDIENPKVQNLYSKTFSTHACIFIFCTYVNFFIVRLVFLLNGAGA